MKDAGLSFCSTQHARVGIERWQEKEKLGITPQNPKPPMDMEQDAEAGGIPEIGGEE